MSLLDWGLVISALAFAFSGYRRGFIAGVLSFVGFLAGAVAGVLLAPILVRSVAPSSGQSLLALGIVLVAASIGQVLFGWVGMHLRARFTWRPLRMLDASLGAAISVVAMLVVVWFLASSLRPGPLSMLSREIGDSRVITEVDQVMPDRARTLFSSFRRVLDDHRLPTVFGGLAPEAIRPVDPPGPAITNKPAVARAATSIVKVVGTASACDRTLDGSGFVVAPHHVLTNAHVVAGVVHPEVQVGGAGKTYRTEVVLFDPERDLAVLYAPGLDAPALKLENSAVRGDQAVVAGFPGGGGYLLEAARVRDVITANGPDIYHRTQVSREVFSLYATVNPGNSGGPLLGLSGGVYGVVFAKSLDDPKTGYALTAGEVSSTVAAGRRATQRVDTDTCT